ncbi:MAG: hypothetical protein LBI49_11005, partial [Nocardiopsaceae bacterium]|nr:hypothetical protein [Nocardiopsaceae bacterium]
SDNIKGAEKIGPKTAAALLRRFGDLQSVIENADSIEKPSVRESVRRNSGRLRNNFRLIKLDDRAPVPFALDDLVYQHGGVATGEVLRGGGAVPVAGAALLALGPARARLAGPLGLPFHAVSALASEAWPAGNCALCASGVPIDQPAA